MKYNITLVIALLVVMPRLCSAFELEHITSGVQFELELTDTTSSGQKYWAIDKTHLLGIHEIVIQDVSGMELVKYPNSSGQNISGVWEKKDKVLFLLPSDFEIREMVILGIDFNQTLIPLTSHAVLVSTSKVQSTNRSPLEISVTNSNPAEEN